MKHFTNKILVIGLVLLGLIFVYSREDSSSTKQHISTESVFLYSTNDVTRTVRDVYSLETSLQDALGKIEGLLTEEEKIIEVEIERLFDADASEDLLKRDELKFMLALGNKVPKELISYQVEIEGEMRNLIGAAQGKEEIEKAIKKLLDDNATQAEAEILDAMEAQDFSLIVRGYEGTVGHPGDPTVETIPVGQIFNAQAETNFYWIADPVDATGNSAKGINPSATIYWIGWGEEPVLKEVPDTRTLSIIARKEAKDAEIRYDRTPPEGERHPVEYNLMKNIKNIAEKLGKEVKDLRFSIGKGTRFDELIKRLKAEGVPDENFTIQSGMYEVYGVAEMFLEDKHDIVIGGMANEMLVASEIARAFGGYSWLAFGSQDGLSSKVKNLDGAWNLTKREEFDDARTYEEFGIMPGPDKVYTMDELLTENGYVFISALAGFGDILKPVQIKDGLVTVESLMIDSSGGVYKIRIKFKGVKQEELILPSGG